MTPAQRQYDLDLAKNMMAISRLIEPRSRKVASVLMLGAQRIQALVASATTLPLPPDDMRDGDLPKQPASTPSSKR